MAPAVAMPVVTRPLPRSRRGTPPTAPAGGRPRSCQWGAGAGSGRPGAGPAAVPGGSAADPAVHGLRMARTAAPGAARRRPPYARRWQPGQSARRRRLAGGRYTNFSVRQYRQSTSRMPPGARTGRPAAVITAAPRAGLVTEPLIGLAAFNAQTASGKGAHGPDRSRPATCGQDRTSPRGKTIRGARRHGVAGMPVPS